MFEALGLSAQADRVYLAMLRTYSDGTAIPSEAVTVSEGNVEEAVAELESAGLLSRTTDGSFRVVPAQSAVELLLGRQRLELAALEARVQRSQVIAGQLVAEYAGWGDTSRLERVVGAEAVAARLARLVAETSRELLIFATGGAHEPQGLEATSQSSLFERGVRSRTVYLSSVRNHKPTLAHADWLRSHGAEVRTAPTLPVYMTISDRRRAVFLTDMNDTSAGAVAVSEPGVIAALSALFESTWSTALPLGGQVDQDEHGLSSDEQTVLTLLAEGLTDNAIAHQMGVSARTTRRIASDLMFRLRARSRFEAGLLAARRGWL